MTRQPFNSSIDHYPFGMVMSERSYSSGDGYRYGFNGMEKDDEVNGEGNSLDFGARIYDSRVGRWMSLDPLQKDYPYLSAYNFVANTPIYYVDPDGRKLKVARHNVGDARRYFKQLGLNKAFKVKRNGTVVHKNRFARKNAALLKQNKDLNDLYSGFEKVVSDKKKILTLKIEEGNYNHKRMFPIYGTRIVTEPVYGEVPDGNGGTVVKKIGSQEVEEKYIVNYREVGLENVSTSQTMYFGDLAPNEVDVILHREDMNEPLDGVDGEEAPGHEAASFAHEVLDHGLDFFEHNKDPDTNDGVANKQDVKFENIARRLLKIRERTGTDHD